MFNIFSDKKPKIGDKIRITYLPSARNAPLEKNAYIGMEGVVDEHFSDGDGFSLHTGTSTLVVHNKPYRYNLMP